MKNSAPLRLLSACCVLVVANPAICSAVLVDFTAGTGTTGSEIDGQQSGAELVPELTLPTTITFSTSTPNGVFNATGSEGGIDRTDVTSGSGDDADRFDDGEVFTFSFSVPVNITDFDFSSIVGSDSFKLTVGGDEFTISDIRSDVDASVFTPVGGISLAANAPISITEVSGNFGLQGINLTAVPEPSAMLFMCVTLTALLARRQMAD